LQVLQLKKLEARVLKETSKTAKTTSKEASSKADARNMFGRLFSMPWLQLVPRRFGDDRIRQSFPPEEPYPGAWLKAGDTEALFDGYGTGEPSP
jgi:hypothetical protein